MSPASVDAAGADEFTLRQFEAVDGVGDIAPYIAALEAFNRLEQLQELKALAIERTGPLVGRRLLDVGCGFGLETLRLARLVGPEGGVVGVDLAHAFIQEARRRAEAAGLVAGFEEGDATALPFADGSFEVARAERVLVYVADIEKALAELRRVTTPGGQVAIIEPDIDSNRINLGDRALVRRVIAHEADTNVRHPSLPGRLPGLLTDAGFRNIEIATRIVIFDPGLAAMYFGDVGRNAARDGAIDGGELQRWEAGIAELARTDRLFATVGYYLFTATR